MYQTFYPRDAAFATANTDTLYVAVYSYPEFEFETVMKDTRTGPAGAIRTRSGIFATENGDLYTVSHSSFGLGFSQSTKPAGILKIPAGTTEFDADYFFNTDEKGGKINRASYLGDGVLSASVAVKESTIDERWGDQFNRLAIVDLNDQTITLVEGAPEFKGAGVTYSDPYYDEAEVKVYSPIADENGVINIYVTDVVAATAIKGAQVDATFVAGIHKLQ